MLTCKLTFVPILSLLCLSCNYTQQEILIRANQVGFIPNENKTAVILSEEPLIDNKYFLKRSADDKIVLIDSIKLSKKNLNQKFQFCAYADFSEFADTGTYYIEYQNAKSYSFRIAKDVFNPVRDSLSLFFRMQRCGPTNPSFHKICHLQDATKVVGYRDSTAVDLTGGWHDAGDYIKFLYTTAFTTYMLLFSYEFDRNKFSFDSDGDQVPDILQEARVGLDFLLRCNFADDAFITQVQDDRDHSVGWRLPEDDPLTFDRPAFVKMNKSQLGIYTAALALASRIWKERFFDYDFAEKCISSALKIFTLKNNIIDYEDEEKYYSTKEYNSKLILGAIELYKTSGKIDYLNYALELVKKIPNNYWWSWGDFNSLIFYKLVEYDSRFIENLKGILEHYKSVADTMLFNEGHQYSWGTTHSFIGVSLSAILYKKITASNEFDLLEVNHRDFLLGRNPWGMCFIHNIGHKFPRNIHHQVGHKLGKYFPGALVSGPVPIELIKKHKLNLIIDENTNFTTHSIYIDETENYLTNEPTISSNATALFVFGHYSLTR